MAEARATTAEARADAAEARALELQAKLVQRDARILKLRRRIAQLEKDSSNSSKPPSSDPLWKPKPPTGSHNKSGGNGNGRSGHAKRTRVPFAADRIDRSWDYTTEGLDPARWEPVPELEDQPDAPPAWSVLQQIDYCKKTLRFTITEHRFRVYQHRVTGRRFTTQRPEGLRVGTPGGGLFGRGMIAWINTARWDLQASVRQLRRFLLDTTDLKVSRGYLGKVLDQAADSLEAAEQEIVAIFRGADVIHADETGHRDRNARSDGTDHCYTWCMSSLVSMATLFCVGRTRSTRELNQILGEGFGGVIHCDFYPAYRKYRRLHPGVELQLCWAHLIRELVAAGELPGGTKLDARNAALWSEAMLRKTKALFDAWHRGSVKACRRARDAIVELCEPWRPWAGHGADVLRKRMRAHAVDYFRFIDTPGNIKSRRIQPTNNHAERMVRVVVLLRKITLGTCSEKGRRWWERLGSTAVTLRQRGRGLFDFLNASLHAAALRLPPPALPTAA